MPKSVTVIFIFIGLGAVIVIAMAFQRETDAGPRFEPKAEQNIVEQKSAELSGYSEAAYNRLRIWCAAAGHVYGTYADEQPVSAARAAKLKIQYPDYFARGARDGLKMANEKIERDANIAKLSGVNAPSIHNMEAECLMARNR